jgi:hypothetical protein
VRLIAMAEPLSAGSLRLGPFAICPDTVRTCDEREKLSIRESLTRAEASRAYSACA